MNRYFKYLFTSYILMFIPQLLTAIFHKNLLMPLYAFCYSINLIIMFSYAIKSKTKFKKRDLFIICIFFFIEITTIITNIIFKINTLFNDYINYIIAILNMIIYYSLIPKSIDKKREVKEIYFGVLIIGIISCLYNFAVNYEKIIHFFSIKNSYTMNLTGLLSNRNTFGSFLFICIICVTYLIHHSEKKEKKYLYLSAMFLFVNLLLTMSRGSIGATLIFLLVYNLKTAKNIKKTLFHIIIIIIIVAILLFHPSIYEFISRVFIRTSAGTTGRSELWKIGYNLWKEKLIAGYGYYTAISRLKASQFHSFYIDTLVDIGIQGVLFKFVFMYSIFKKIKRKIKNNNDSYYLITYSSYIGMLFLSIFESLNIFSLGFTETQIMIFFITIPIYMLKNDK